MGPEDEPAEMLRPLFSRPPSLRLFVPSPVVCSSWEIYGGSINGFYRQLLERAEQGLAVGGPSRRLTAKTLKYYGRTYIKSVPCASSAASLLLTQEHGVWPENSSRSQLLARHKCPQAFAPAPATRAEGCPRGCRETHANSSTRLPASSCTARLARVQGTKFLEPQDPRPAVPTAMQALPSPRLIPAPPSVPTHPSGTWFNSV